MLSTPVLHLLHHWEQVQACAGEAIFHLGGNDGIHLTLKNIIFFQFAQLLGQHFGRDTGNTLEQFVVTIGALRQIPDNDEFPFAPDGCQGGFDRAMWDDVGSLFHRFIIVRTYVFCAYYLYQLYGYIVPLHSKNTMKGTMKNTWNSLPRKEVVEATAAQLEEHGVTVEVVANKKEALTRLKDLIPSGAQVMTGSSTTLQQIGFAEYLESGKHDWKNLHASIVAENDDSKRNTLRRTAVTAEYFVASANALTEDGKIVAVDATGSRVGALPYAAEKVILVISTQKITKNLDDALARIRDHVFPLEDKRMQDAYGMGSNLAKWIIIEKEFVPGRITILLVEEALGF